VPRPTQNALGKCQELALKFVFARDEVVPPLSASGARGARSRLLTRLGQGARASAARVVERLERVLVLTPATNPNHHIAWGRVEEGRRAQRRTCWSVWSACWRWTSTRRPCRRSSHGRPRRSLPCCLLSMAGTPQWGVHLRSRAAGLLLLHCTAPWGPPCLSLRHGALPAGGQPGAACTPLLLSGCCGALARHAQEDAGAAALEAAKRALDARNPGAYPLQGLPGSGHLGAPAVRAPRPRAPAPGR